MTTDDAAAPRTGDHAVDDALQHLEDTPGLRQLGSPADQQHPEPTASDLDAILAAGEDVHRRLTSRLSDLGT